MRPFTVLIGIVLGSAASISFGLATVLIVFCILGRDNPDLAREFPPLAESFVAFLFLTAAGAGSFLGEIKQRPWRGWAHLAVVLCLGAIVWFYWPGSG